MFHDQMDKLEGKIALPFEQVIYQVIDTIHSAINIKWGGSTTVHEIVIKRLETPDLSLSIRNSAGITITDNIIRVKCNQRQALTVIEQFFSQFWFVVVDTQYQDTIILYL